MTARAALRCLILGHHWTAFHAEQCPLEYRTCNRCRATKHECNSIKWKESAK